MKVSLDSVEIRRRVLHNGGDIRATARELEMSHSNVIYHLKRANQAHPLTEFEGDPEDQVAVAEYKRKCLTRMGIAHGQS